MRPPGTRAREQHDIPEDPRAARGFASTYGSPVASRTVSRRIDRSIAVELRREQPDIPRRGPLHVGDFRDRSPVRTWVAVAIETPAHTEGHHLRDRFHLVDAAVARDAADSCRHVRAVREIR